MPKHGLNTAKESDGTVRDRMPENGIKTAKESAIAMAITVAMAITIAMAINGCLDCFNAHLHCQSIFPTEPTFSCCFASAAPGASA